jgi:hypothetical protein
MSPGSESGICCNLNSLTDVPPAQKLQTLTIE